MIPLPAGYIDQLRPLLGSSLSDFLACYQAPARRGIRFSIRRRPPFVSGLDAAIPWARAAWTLQADMSPGQHPLHEAGAYYLQEPSAMAAASALAPKPGDLVLDLCAAPGGKASQIGDQLMGQGALVANEINPARARVLSRNLERMGILNAAVTNESPARLAEKLPQAFDKILVDAPCSGEGMFRREPESRLQWHQESPQGCAQRQREILKSAAQMLRPGGQMVYSTCTFNETENEGVIAQFLKEHPDFYLHPFALPGLPEAPEGLLRIWPHLHSGEGHFVALLKREGADKPQALPRENKSLKHLKALMDDWADAPASPNQIAGKTAVYQALELPELRGLRVTRSGYPLIDLNGSRPKPAHGLALISQPRQTLPFNAEEARLFQQGHPLLAPDGLTGWAAACLEGWPLGWGKATGGILKNHYPKGLRRPL